MVILLADIADILGDGEHSLDIDIHDRYFFLVDDVEITLRTRPVIISED